MESNVIVDRKENLRERYTHSTYTHANMQHAHKSICTVCKNIQTTCLPREAQMLLQNAMMLKLLLHTV